MRRIALLMIIVLLMIIIIISLVYYLNEEIVLTGSSNDYYVAKDGSDLNDGLSPNTPWRTIGKVNSELNGGVVNIGDDIYFKRGDTWSDSTLYPRLGGNVSDEMIFGAYGSGPKPIILGTCNGIVGVAGISHTRFENFSIKDQQRVIGSGGNGLMLWDFVSYNITISNIDVDDCGSNGIGLRQVIGYRIDNCTVSNCHTSGIVIYGSSSNRIRDGIIRDCIVHDIATNDCYTLHRQGSGYGSHIGPNHALINCTGYNAGEENFDITSGTNVIMKDCESYGKFGISVNHDVENFFVDNFYSHDEASNKYGIVTNWATNLTIRNSVFYNWGKDCFGLNDGAGPKSLNLFVVHNTVVYDGNEDIIQFDSLTENVVMKNNIFTSMQNDSPSLFLNHINGANVGNTNSEYSHNIWWRGDGGAGDDTWWDDDVEGAQMNLSEWNALSEVLNERVMDPELADSANGDFSLNVTSPAIDAGDWLTTTNGNGNNEQWITVHEARYFHDGFGVIDGDKISVGVNLNLEVIDVNYGNRSIKVNLPISWDYGDTVSLVYSGSAPDIGAYEFVSTALELHGFGGADYFRLFCLVIFCFVIITNKVYIRQKKKIIMLEG